MIMVVVVLLIVVVVLVVCTGAMHARAKTAKAAAAGADYKAISHNAGSQERYTPPRSFRSNRATFANQDNPRSKLAGLHVRKTRPRPRDWLDYADVTHLVRVATCPIRHVQIQKTIVYESFECDSRGKNVTSKTGVSNHSNSLPLYSSRPGRPPKRASVGLSLAASHLAAAAGHHPQHSLKKHRMDNGDYYENGHLDVPRMEKSPLLANGYNHPPTHLSHMQFMQLGGHPGAGHTAILSPASLPHHLQAQAQARAEQGLKVNPNMTNIEALARSGTVWENCRAAYEDIVKHLER
ncbi:hypothetical protein M0804_002712 [Polistes exclamans]|nr:hypothetical protein M0804_002712 [Polistes exclamans]